MTHLNEQGFQITPDVISADECDALIATLSEVTVQRSRAGARHLMSLPLVAALANDKRLGEITDVALGPRALAYRVTLFDKSQNANWSVVWHQDTALPLRTKFEKEGWGPWSTKAGIHYAHAPTAALARVLALRVHLDDSNATNGPLLVIPGSHREGVLTDEQVSAIAQSRRYVQCLVPRGGVLAMRPMLIHSSPRISGGASRRVLHIEYAEDIEIQSGVFLTVA